MIQKIGQNTIKIPNRKELLKVVPLALGVLAGSSMSGWHDPSYITVTRIIPGGCSFKEKLYMELKGTVPPSVRERWIGLSKDYVWNPEDRVMKVNIYDGKYIGEIVERPHRIDLTLEDIDKMSNLPEKIYEDLLNKAAPITISNSDNTDIISDISNDDETVADILKHIIDNND